MIEQVFELHTELLKAMAHPKRLEIINLLGVKELTVGEIQVMLGMAQANLSQHLQALRAARIVTTRKDGKKVYYRLAHRNFVEAGDLLRQVLLERYKDSPLGKNLKMELSEIVPQVLDPVCGMWLSPKTAAFGLKHGKDKYYFCASGCLKKFKKNHRQYVTNN
jgi:ArsR family transcriptional regulator